MTFQVSSLASSRNSLVGTSSSECRQLPETVWPKVAANFFQNTFIGNTSSPRISALSQVLPDKILRIIAAISGTRLSLATVYRLSLLSPANEF